MFTLLIVVIAIALIFDLVNGFHDAANSIATFDIKQVISATQIIQGGASNTAVNFHIAGVEIA